MLHWGSLLASAGKTMFITSMSPVPTAPAQSIKLHTKHRPLTISRAEDKSSRYSYRVRDTKGPAAGVNVEGRSIFAASSFPIAVRKHHNQMQLGEEQVYSSSQLLALCQEKQRPRPWKNTTTWLALALMALSACLLIQPRATYTAVDRHPHIHH